ncbi:unnamed protein product [Paramecium sonneborni]|uniref:Uncharacterized protein n=1 Tax=Paramecium sonneborni TaxID=65129 RepID=A0A8S1LEH9_9CILI|nr:unnamed protein product [Paramecium sonneborni]
MKRRQIQVGSPFDEAQINYAIQVPNQPLQEPVQYNAQINVPTIPKVQELAPIQEIDFREALLQEIDSMHKQEPLSVPQVQQQIFQSQEKTAPQQSQPTTQQTQTNQQMSRAQQLIQQSQQLMQRRRQPKQQEQQHQIEANQNQQQSNTSSQNQQANSNQLVKVDENIQKPQIQTIEKQELQQPKEQEFQQQKQQKPQQEQSQIFQKQNQGNLKPIVEVQNNQEQQKQIDLPNNQLNENQNEKVKQTQIQKTRQQIPVQKNKETEGQVFENVFKEQQPSIQQQMMNINQKIENQSSVITAQTFYHGLVSYDIQSNQLTKLRFGSIASQYPGPYFKNRNPDNLRQLRYFWASYNTNNALQQLIIDHLEKPLEKNSALQIIESKLLNNQSGSDFVEAYVRIYNQNDWETKLLVCILQGELINTKQQQSLIEYIKKRSYHDDQEAWLIRLAVLLKMVPIDQEYYSELLIQLQHLYSSEQIQARLLWLLLKMDIQNTQLDVFLLSFFTKFNYSLCHSEIQLLIGDSHMCFHNQQNAELYYKLSLLFVESENYDKALECVKFSIDLGYHSKARDLRDRILQVIELKEKNKSNNNNNSNGGGLLGYFGQAVNAVKQIQKQPQQQQQQSYQPQPQNFYYDKQLKAYVINGVPQIAPPEEEQKKEVVVVAPPPPRRKIDPPKPIVQEEQLTQQTQEISEDPFANQSQTHQSEHNKKKNNLLRNRYVQ